MPSARRRRRPERLALLIIDFINPLDFPGAARLRAGALRAARRTRALKRKARAAGLPCIYLNDHFGHWNVRFEDLVETVARANADSRRLVELLRPEPDDIPILKPRHSGFYGTALEFLLDELEATHLILTGLATDNCVFATAQDAYVRKYHVWIPSDCVAAQAGTGEAGVLRHMARVLKAKTARFSGALWPGGS